MLTSMGLLQVLQNYLRKRVSIYSAKLRCFGTRRREMARGKGNIPARCYNATGAAVLGIGNASEHGALLLDPERGQRVSLLRIQNPRRKCGMSGILRE